MIKEGIGCDNMTVILIILGKQINDNANVKSESVEKGGKSEKNQDRQG